jgi:hypothetical protein
MIQGSGQIILLKQPNLFAMALTIDEYRCKLINKILFARSQDEVKRFINVAMKSLQEHKVNGHIIARFIDKVLQHLNEFRPVYYNTQQWNNIKTARVQFNAIKHAIQEEEHH